MIFGTELKNYTIWNSLPRHFDENLHGYIFCYLALFNLKYNETLIASYLNNPQSNIKEINWQLKKET